MHSNMNTLAENVTSFVLLLSLKKAIMTVGSHSAVSSLSVKAFTVPNGNNVRKQMTLRLVQ